MSHVTKIRLYTSARRWLIFSVEGFSADVWVEGGRLLVRSADARLKNCLEQQIHRLVISNSVEGVSMARTKVPGRRDTITHFVEPKKYSDPGFLGWLWQNPVWDRQQFAGHKVIKKRSELVWSRVTQPDRKISVENHS